LSWCKQIENVNAWNVTSKSCPASECLLEWRTNEVWVLQWCSHVRAWL